MKVIFAGIEQGSVCVWWAEVVWEKDEENTPDITLALVSSIKTKLYNSNERWCTHLISNTYSRIVLFSFFLKKSNSSTFDLCWNVGGLVFGRKGEISIGLQWNFGPQWTLAYWFCFVCFDFSICLNFRNTKFDELSDCQKNRNLWK